ncbi:MAG: YihA family ribosome biogenesis GTP-binding protein [Desulfobacula sp.]|jgi:GTP-binding protein|uniref:ribosome biogenesis GTP-binding protein YihA/YsxC n=1 Tax=Desulfobacula sp. TaxID=2593537 RepID=UPI001D26EF3B|nr:YihA family ribosome biogenesis GTP-binding protein [Desulfobacula sp.]MBT3485019.1 YihA family ribosome biogenesis GTP-binding protein [Desulfobacula sp.]MBT3804164.1 YihA family ribosome biogenesis GTP-binding protein [Desulfobacula sp.]MBT4025020.1 YihA family ribosome biogenesis GTP-binding protein [Desulfobacula sp.]MBT4198670.1 YihA family ribosome biogenesis GTP-binding protein [Desulfobacula sp.]
MIIKNVEFIKSAVKPSQYPEYDFPEIAFAGRSNVGKSSLINTLILRKDLVKTSSKPGCTQLINFFLVNENLSFVDLPGYGYAKVSKKIKSQWQPMVDLYLSHRQSLLGLVLLMDIRRDPAKEEFDMMDWLEANKIPYLLILTKSDKLSKTKQQKRLLSICSKMNREKHNVICFSTRTKMGRDTILEEIGNLIGGYNE